MEKYLLKAQNVYRVPTVDDALKLREELEHIEYGELTSFAYNTKYIKIKGEVVEEYQVVKATIQFTDEKDPDSHINATYEMEF